MINVEFKRNEYVIKCDGCGRDIHVDEPSYRLEFGVQDNTAEQTISLCEDCGGHLQNDMSNEFCKFVDLCM